MAIEPRFLRPAPQELGHYLRPNRNDHRVLLQLLSENRLNISGLVLDPCLWSRHEELAREARANRLEVILDTRSVELSTAGGFARSGISELPWAGSSPHDRDLSEATIALIAEQIAEFAVNRSCSAVLAPTHFIERGNDEWLHLDRLLTEALRGELDRVSARRMPIYYPLILHSSVLRDDMSRLRIKRVLSHLPIDALWLRVHPFGTNSAGPSALSRYIHGARDFHDLGLPIVGERTGTIGLPLLAFGVVGGIESGITYGEGFDIGPYRRVEEGNGFLPPPRIYLQQLECFLSRRLASSLFDHRGTRSIFGCQDVACCPRGISDTIRDPRRHFVVRRASEVHSLSVVPQAIRATVYMDRMLRPASDRMVTAIRAVPELDTHRERLDSWRATLSVLLEQDREMAVTHSAIPQGHRMERRLGA